MAYLYMFRQLWRYAGPERWKVVVYLLLHAVSILGELGKPLAFAMVINALQANRPTLIHEVTHWLLIYVVCYLTFEGMHRPSRYLEVYVAFRNRRRFIDAMYQRLQSLPLRWHTEHHSGNVIDRVNKAADALHQFGVAQMNYVCVVMKFWGPLIILWAISPRISLAGLLVGILLVFITRRLYDITVPLYRGQLEGIHDFAAAFYDYMGNMRTVITLRLGGQVKQDLDARLARVFPLIVKEHNVTQVKCLSTALLILLLEVGVIFYYIQSQTQAGALIMIGSVTAIFQYLRQLMESFQFYAGDYEQVIHWKTDFEAITPLLAAEGRPAVPEHAGLAEWREIVIHPLSFSYGDGKLHLQDVALRLARGQKIALVGESGSGKSTLLQVLRGLSDIPGAGMTVDGAPAPLAALATTTTLIPQEPELFENTIRHNVTMGLHAEEEDVQAALRVAEFTPVVAGLPNGLDSDIREKGVNLSGGEKQRLALARGLFAVRDSTIVLLDEPTSNIDPRTELAIITRLFATLAGKCIVSSLHRLHLLRLFDYVYVMQHGRIVEEGTFAELSSGDGEFARLWAVYQAEKDNISDREARAESELSA